MLCRWAGAPDPCANEWGTWGNSTTIAAVLQHLLTPAALRQGDIVTFGPDGSKHAAMVLETGLDPLLWGFGHQGAPSSSRLSEDRREHQLLRLPVPALDPDDEALRKMTGYWSWLAFTLGEAAWRNHPPFDRSVRPDVPRLIPPSWWRRRLRFLRARTKANPSTTRTP
jgi:hypothetical protein